MPNVSRPNRLQKFLPALSALGLLIALFSWAVASPVGASPDDDFHLVSTWCAGDGQVGMCEIGGKTTERKVSEALVYSACFALKSEIGAECQADLDLFNRSELVETSRGNFDGKYPQLFYGVMHQFASSDIQTSAITMRIFNATLFVAILSALWLLIPKFLRATLYFTVALTIIPLGLFLIPSINPSSWAIIGVVAAFFGTSAALQVSTSQKYALWAIALLGVVLAAGARYDGSIYAVISATVAFFLAKQFTIPRKVFWSALVAIGVIGTAALFSGGSAALQNMIGLAGNASASVERSALAIFALNLASITELWAGFSGSMGLGWLDTPMPTTAWMTVAALLWGTIFMRLSSLKRKQLWTAVGLFGLLAIIPLVTLQAGNSVVGENVQSRYIYPLFLVFVSTVLLRHKRDSGYFSNTQIMVITLGLFVSQALSIFANMSRFISGIGGEGFSPNLNQAAESGWWWPAGPAPMTVLAFSIIGFGLSLATAFLFQKSKNEPLDSSREFSSVAPANGPSLH